MNKIIYFGFILILIAGCSLQKNSKFWTATQDISKESNPNYKGIFIKEEALAKELNSNL